MNSEEIKKQTQETEKLTSAQEENLRITRDINNEIREGLKLIDQEKDLKNAVRKSLTLLNKQAEFQVDIQNTTNKALTDTNGLIKKQQDFTKGLNSLRRENRQLAKSIAQQERDFAATKSTMSKEEQKATQQKIADAKKLQKGIADQIINQKDSKKALESQVAVSKQLADLGSVKLFGSLSQIAGAIPGVKGLTSGFDAAAKASKEAAANSVKIGPDGVAKALGPLDKLKAGFKGLAAGVNEMMKSFGMVAIIGKLIQGLLRADKSTASIAKNLNQTYSQAEITSKQLKEISNNSDDIAVTYDGVKSALVDINAEFGTSANLSNKTLEQFASLQKRAGLTSEELMGMQKITFAIGGSLRENADSFLDQVNATKEQFGVSINSKKVMAEINKLSAATALSLGRNPKELAKAVTTAKALGFEMSTLEGVASSLLDFESSIEKEMEAELLLGKQLNLEKAREFALTNNMAGLAEEIASQVGSAADFQKMNRLEAEALANAVGMSREELAQTLFEQEQLKGLSEEDAAQRKIVLEQLTKQHGQAKAEQMIKEQGIETLEAQLGKQEEMALAAEKLNEVFLNLGTALQPALTVMTGIAEFAAKNLELIMGSIAAYKTYNMVTAAQKAIRKANIALAGKDAAKGLAGYAVRAAKAVAGIPFVGPALAIAAGLAAFAAGRSLLKKSDAEAKDDVMLPGMSKAGYGDRMISAPEGTFALNNKDTIIAGTNLDQGSNTATANVDMSETNNLLRQILNKNANIKMDSEDLGTAVSLNNYEISA